MLYYTEIERRIYGIMSKTGLKRVALIGYGGMGGWHVKHIQAGGAVELAGIYDIDPAKAEKAKERGIYAYSSLEELLADESVELVTIATPNQLHRPLAIQAMAAGAVSSLQEMRNIIHASVETEEFVPQLVEEWEKAYQKFTTLK